MSLFVGVFLANGIVILLSYERLMGIFFEKRRVPLFVFVGVFLLFYIVSSVAFLILAIPVVSLVISLFFLYIITLCYDSSIKKRVVAVVCIFAIMLSIEMLVFIGFMGYPAYIYVQGMALDLDIFALAIMSTAYYSTALALRKLKDIRKSKIQTYKLFLSTIAIPVFSVILLWFIIMHLPFGMAIATVIALFIINVFVFYHQNHLAATYEEKLKSALEAQEKDYYMLQCKLMQESVEQVKALRHDMKLHLSTAKGFADKSKAEEAAEYLSGLLGKISKTEVYSDTGNIVFDSIINFKLNNANIENFKPELNLLLPPETGIEVPDIITILGNLLDNAIDALTHTTDKHLKLDIEYSKDSLFIKIDNAFDGSIKYSMGSGGNPNHIVSRKKGSDHGYGLKNIRSAVEKYNGHIDISHEGNMFSVGVLLYSPDEEEDEQTNIQEDSHDE